MAELELTDGTVIRAAPALNAQDISGWRDEIDHYYLSMQQFEQCETDEIFMSLAGFSARASEVRTRLQRMQTRAATAFRTQEIDPFLEEVDRQFKLWSRVQAVREMDFKLSGRTT
jgi:hypothetical protein